MELEERKPVNKAHVQRRVRDWKRRVSKLYKDIQNWLTDKPEYTLVTGQPMRMFEEPMEQFVVQPQNIDTADLFKDKQLLLTFKPKGLWVIGANGRIDIISRKGNYILIDYSEQFEKPKWHIYTTQDRKNGKPFNKTELLNIL
ncbi:MAG: hypothetical protein WD048_12040 [Chitinophagales bacterium]